MRKAFIIFSGYNQRAVVAFLRTLTAEKIGFGIIASSKKDTITKSAYAGRVFDVRSDPELSVENVIGSIRRVKKRLEAGGYIIAPSTEALNRFMIANKKALEREGCEVPLAGKKLYETVSDKRLFTRVCTENGITIPREYGGFEAARPPFAAKPKKYFSAGGGVNDPVLVFNGGEKQAFAEKHDVSDFFFQEYVSGRSIYLLYYFSKGGDVLKYSQENLAQQPCGKSIVAARSAAWHTGNESLKYERLFKKIGFTGLVMVEVREHGGKFYMIEANPRFWGPSQLFVDAGANFFEALLFDLGLKGSLPDFGNARRTRYFWHGGMLEAGENCVFHGGRGRSGLGRISGWTACDVYNRPDTAGIYKKETSGSGAK